MEKNDEEWPTITEVVEETLKDISKVVDNKETIEEFKKLNNTGQ